MAPREVAFGGVEENAGENGTELAPGNQSLRGCIDLPAAGVGVALLAIAVDHVGGGLIGEVKGNVAVDCTSGPVLKCAGFAGGDEVGELAGGLGDVIDDLRHDLALRGDIGRGRGWDFGRRQLEGRGDAARRGWRVPASI